MYVLQYVLLLRQRGESKGFLGRTRFIDCVRTF